MSGEDRRKKWVILRICGLGGKAALSPEQQGNLILLAFALAAALVSAISFLTTNRTSTRDLLAFEVVGFVFSSLLIAYVLVRSKA